MKPTPEMVALGRACFGVNFNKDINLLVERIYETMDNKRPPIPMVLYCPVCGVQHIDRDESPSDREWSAQSAGDRERQYWTNPPHRSHLCAGCGYVWRPADVCTIGVASIDTKGKTDSKNIADFKNEVRLKIIEECAQICDGEEKSWHEFFMMTVNGSRDKDAEQHSMSSSMSAGNCAEAIRRLDPAYAIHKDVLSEKIKEYVKKVRAGDLTATLPVFSNFKRGSS